MKICAVVVTYNRKKLLIECVNAIIKQSVDVFKLIIIDNNSTDGTYEYLQENGILKNDSVIYKKLDENIGGAGGFYEGIKHAESLGVDWVWIMDDDTIPEKTCLEGLCKAIPIISDDISYLASSVCGMNGDIMNIPTVATYDGKSFNRLWSKYLADGIIEITEATFVSLLINAKAIKQVGYPYKNYFIWGDDTEYTLRLVNYYGKAFLVGNSKAIHKREGSQSLSIVEETNPRRIDFYYYMVRNNYVNIKTYYGYKRLIKYILKWNKIILVVLFSKSKNKFKKISRIIKGLADAIIGKYGYKDFKNRFKI